jgi:hypothetical protein
MMSKTTEFMKKVLLDYEESLRQTGRTSHLIEQAKATNSVIVCHNFSFVYAIKKEHDVEAISLDTYLSEEYYRGKKPRSFIFDSPAEYEIIRMKLEEAEQIMGMGEKSVWGRLNRLSPTTIAQS